MNFANSLFAVLFVMFNEYYLLINARHVMVFGELECPATIHLKKSDGHEYMKKHLTLNKAGKAATAKVQKPLIQANNNDKGNKEKQVIIEIVPDKLDSKHPDHEKCQKTIIMTLSTALIEDADPSKDAEDKHKKGKSRKPTRALKVDLGKCDFHTGTCANTELFTADNSRTILEDNSYTENSHPEAHSTAGTTHSDHPNTHPTPESMQSDANHEESTVDSHQPSASSHSSDHGKHAIDEKKADKSKNSDLSPEVDASFAVEFIDSSSDDSHLPTQLEHSKSQTGHITASETNTAGLNEAASTANKTVDSTHISPPHGIKERSRELSGQPGVHTADQNKIHDETPEVPGSPNHTSPADSSNHTASSHTTSEGLLIESPDRSSTANTASVHSSPRQSQEMISNHQTHNETPHGLAGLPHVNSHSSGHKEVEHIAHDGRVGNSHTSDLVRSKPVHFLLHGHLYCGENNKYVKNEVSATIRLRESHFVVDKSGKKIDNSDELHVEEDFTNHQSVKCAIGPANVPICKYTAVKKFGKVPRYIAPVTLVDARLSNVCKKKSGHECKQVEAVKQIRLDIEPKEKECSNFKSIRTTIQLKRMDRHIDERTKDVIYQVNLGSCDFRTGRCSVLGKYIGK
ncbi:hypothetical protein Ddc_03855 [Ditylenchus destructor]|nr:hypothetical protein Ddc_03855 [Ditylenchus destructor]